MCANISGTDKHPLLVLSKSAKPRCFNNVKSFPKEYDANNSWKSGWQVRYLWNGSQSSRLVKDNNEMCIDRRQLPHSSQDETIEECDLVFLASGHDQGVIWNLKHHYQKLVISSHLCTIERKTEVEKITILDASRPTTSMEQHDWNYCHQLLEESWLQDFPADITDIQIKIDDDPLNDLPLTTLVGDNFIIGDYVSDDNLLRANRRCYGHSKGCHTWRQWQRRGRGQQAER